jgi:DNA-binding Lrp family transcriptional regulator
MLDKFDLSELDKNILKGLKEDGRIPYTHLAEKLNIPDTTLHFRVKKLKERGIIKKFTILLDNPKDSITALIKIVIGQHTILKFSREKAKALGNKLKNKFNFIALSEDKITIYGIITLENEEKLQNLLHEIKRDPDIEKIEYLKLNVLKGEDFLSLNII